MITSALLTALVANQLDASQQLADEVARERHVVALTALAARLDGITDEEVGELVTALQSRSVP